MVRKKRAVPSIPPSHSPPWIDLPTDLTVNILDRLDVIERLHIAYNVCTTWRTLCRDCPQKWRIIHISKSTITHLNTRQLEIVCRIAVDCSHGQLLDITMDGFCTDNLLLYISDRCSQLQRLRVAFTDKITGNGLIKALEKLPLLSELYLFAFFSKSPFSEYDIQAIGRSCPLLKSFTFTYRVHLNGLLYNDEGALAVAQNMSGLRHLCLLGNPMSENGLRAILDGCPKLESLDIRLCKNLDHLPKRIIERCHSQVRQVWLPKDSCSDHEFYDRLGDLISWVDALREAGFYSQDHGWCLCPFVD